MDLWGRLRAERDAAEAGVRAGRADLRAAGVSLSAEVAGAWLDWLETRARLALLQGQAETNRRTLELTELRFRQGRGAAPDVLRQRQLAEATDSKIVDARAERTRAANRLAALLGELPGGLDLPDGAALPDAPGAAGPVKAGRAIMARPDVRRAQARLAEAGVETSKRREHGDPAETIIEVAEELDVDNITMSGRRRSPTGKMLFGSTTQSVLLAADRPVTVILDE